MDPLLQGTASFSICLNFVSASSSRPSRCGQLCEPGWHRPDITSNSIYSRLLLKSTWGRQPGRRQTPKEHSLNRLMTQSVASKFCRKFCLVNFPFLLSRICNDHWGDHDVKWTNSEHIHTCFMRCAHFNVDILLYSGSRTLPALAGRQILHSNKQKRGLRLHGRSHLILREREDLN